MNHVSSRLVRLRSMGLLLSVGLAGLAGASGALVACGGSDGVDITDDGPTDEPGQNNGKDAGGSTSGENPGEPGGFGNGEADAGVTTKDDSCKKMDIVFIVDNSGSMGQEQENLAKNFPKFGTIIDGYKTKGGDLLDYRLAVLTTDVPKGRGAFLKTAPTTELPPWWPFGSPDAKCDPGPDRPWLERADGKPADFFACRALVGTGGSADELPLASLYMGLTDRIKDGTNAAGGSGFLRDDALLAFIAITDEDESSDKPPITDYPGMFDALKGGERGRWAASVIAGEKECSSDEFGNAEEAVQLKQFVKDVGKNGIFSSICEGDLTVGVTKALNLFGEACKTFPSGVN